MTRIVLIRHGESQCNLDQVVGGHEGCTGLSDHGHAQAAALGQRLARTGELGEVAAVYSSVLPRAIETAGHLTDALGGIDAVSDCGLCEVHPGDADALTWDEARERFDLSRSTYHPWAPGSESWAEFVARVGSSLSRLATKHAGSTVVVACHGGVVDASFSVFGHVSLYPPFELRTEYTAITEWHTEGDPALWPPARWRLARYNDDAHLADVSPPASRRL